MASKLGSELHNSVDWGLGWPGVGKTELVLFDRIIQLLLMWIWNGLSLTKKHLAKFCDCLQGPLIFLLPNELLGALAPLFEVALQGSS